MRRPKAAKLAQCPRLRAVVEAKLELRWSPQQISGWLALAFPDDPEMRVSHETIYLSLYVHARGALRRELARNLRTGRVTAQRVADLRALCRRSLGLRCVSAGRGPTVTRAARIAERRDSRPEQSRR